MKPGDHRLRILVGGYIGLLPAGGVTWDYLQYVLGLASLGHDVFYVEDTRVWPIYQEPVAGSVSCESNVSHLARVMNAFGLDERWAYRDEMSGATFGMTECALLEVCRSADVFINVSCSTFLRDEYARIPVRILIDSDPMFTQIQAATQQGYTPGLTGISSLIAGHNNHFTFGESVGQEGCRIPMVGVAWQPTRQPICLDHWPVTPLSRTASAVFTTVMNWTAGRPQQFEGEEWGQKDVEFLRFIDAPSRAPAALAAVVGQTTGDPFPAERARNAGWRLLDPHIHTSDWITYRDLIQKSRGEFAIAKETYVKARTGWFSCRSACYLASGRPVVAQDTGWTKHVPHDRGLFGFVDLDGAISALEEIMRDPETHARGARQIAEESFDARVVLGNLLVTAGAG